jgi:hypothetical protein
MKIFGMNCQGLGNDPTVRALSDIRKKYDPDVMFLSETHLADFPADCIRRRMNMDFKICNPTTTRSGGVLLLWKREITIQQIYSAPKYIDVKVLDGNNSVWRLTGFYGEPKWQDRYKSWDKMRELNGQYDLPWVVLGDFNEILFSHEKDGGNPRSQNMMQAFRDSLDDCGLVDLGFTGDSFTWKRGRLRERLDRAVANHSWSHLFPNAMVRHLEYAHSDHRPIMIDTEFHLEASNMRSGHHWFEARWFREKDFRDVVLHAWEEASVVGQEAGVLGKLGHLHATLHKWDNSVLQKPKKRLRQAQREFERAVSQAITDESEAKAKELSELIEMLLEQEEVHWLQRSRANWLSQGDRNTTFFHNYASARHKKNFIKKLKNDAGSWVEGTESLKPVIFQYFSNLFSSEVQEIDLKFLDKIQGKVSQEMNDKLLLPFTVDEVKMALFSIGDYKAPGPDGIHAVFYKKFWDLCGVEITLEVLQALNSGVIPEGWNDTTVVLIPKVDDPELVTQFRPISLCNVIYKIISKILSIRLKGILPEIISPMQSAFVPGRLITDNVLVAYESIHAIKNKKLGATGTCAVKLDMHKAYDRVEWLFLENMMRKMGFDERWISLMMACVRSVRYQVRFNSEETESFIPTRGLRQGDPLSPYLFLLCAEGISSLLLYEQEVGYRWGSGVQKCTVSVTPPICC